MAVVTSVTIGGERHCDDECAAIVGQAPVFSARHRAMVTLLEIKRRLLDLAHGVHDERTERSGRNFRGIADTYAAQFCGRPWLK
jgi:hypothetical protein